MYGEAEYEPSPLVARSLVSSIVPDAAAAAAGPVEPTSGDTGTGSARTTSTGTSTIVGDGPVTRMTRSSSSYEKFERHEEVHEVHGAVATDAAHGGPTAFSHNNYNAGQTNTSAGTPSRFKFACDTSAPTELAKMQDEAQKRRELFQSRVTEIEKQAAAWTARLANETIDRELHHEEVMEKSIRQPLEDVAERIMDRLEKRLGSRSFLLGDAPGCAEADSNDNGNVVVDADTNNADENKSRKIHAPSIMALDRKASELEEALIQHSSNCYNGRVEHLDAKIDTLIDEVQPALRLETIKADQREGALNRQYIAVAADATRRYAEENAARVADHEMLRATKEEKATEQPCDAEKILAEIRALGLLLDDERSERQRADEEIMATIIETRKAWQKIVIESLGD